MTKVCSDILTLETNPCHVQRRGIFLIMTTENRQTPAPVRFQFSVSSLGQLWACFWVPHVIRSVLRQSGAFLWPTHGRSFKVHLAFDWRCKKHMVWRLWGAPWDPKKANTRPFIQSSFGVLFRRKRTHGLEAMGSTMGPEKRRAPVPHHPTDAHDARSCAVGYSNKYRLRGDLSD